MSKVLWISDFSIKHNAGGAQRSDALLIAKGAELGHDILHFTLESNPSLLDQHYDHIICANIEGLSQRLPYLIDFLHGHPNYSRLEHDMNRYLSQHNRHKLFLGCKNTFFLTDYHYQLFKQRYGDFFVNVRIVSDPIDTSVFFDRNQPREDKTLYVGFMHEFKGTFDFFDYVFSNPNEKFVVAAWGSPLFTHLATTTPNVEFLGTVPYEKMPELYNKYKTFMYIPRIEEPFCRSVGEAFLCGQELLVNQKIGCCHEYNRVGKDAFTSGCNNAPTNFWRYIFP